MTDAELLIAFKTAKAHIEFCWTHLEDIGLVHNGIRDQIDETIDEAITALKARIVDTENVEYLPGQLQQLEVLMPSKMWRTCKPDQYWLIRLTGAPMLNGVRVKRIFRSTIEFEPISRANGMIRALYELDKDFSFIEQLGD